MINLIIIIVAMGTQPRSQGFSPPKFGGENRGNEVDGNCFLLCYKAAAAVNSVFCKAANNFSNISKYSCSVKQILFGQTKRKYNRELHCKVLNFR